ncbi:hypothetical protein, partial [Staphylococcus chromogenes]|uniref:hypothetical protein n=1 Tax=Staphylococcus chromogenes TaxID=46126 RepID=UPI000FF1882D
KKINEKIIIKNNINRNVKCKLLELNKKMNVQKHNKSELKFNLAYKTKHYSDIKVKVSSKRTREDAKRMNSVLQCKGFDMNLKISLTYSLFIDFKYIIQLMNL